MEDRTIPFRIYEHLIVHPKIKSYKWSIIVYSSIGTPKQLRGSFYTGRPEHAKPFLLPSSPCPFESGRRCLVQLYDGHVWAAFRDDRDRLIHASSGRMVAHIISNSRQFYSVHHSLGRVYVRSAGSLFIWADSPDEVVKSVDRILALAPERAEDELSEFFDFNALSAEEDLKISPPAQDVYNPSALSDPSNAAKEFQQAEVSRYFDSSPVVVPPALLSSPFSLSASPLSFPDVSNFMDLSHSASTSATASPAYLSATLCPGDAFGLPSSKGRWADAFDSILDIDLPRIALAKQCAVSGANCAEMANTLGAPEIPVLPDTVSAQYTPLLPTVAPAPSRSPRLNDVKRTTSKSKANQTRKPSSRRAVKKNVCEHCGANFTRAQDLERHVNSSCTAAPVDVRKPRPRHICELCGETLSRKDAAIRHMNNESCFSKRRKRNNPSVY